PNEDISPKRDIVISISAVQVSQVSVSGVASVKIENVDTESLSLVVSGAGSMEAQGKVEYATFVASGVGSMSAENLHAANARVTMSGAGKADVYATEELVVNISGAGAVHYYGDPKHVTRNISGVGFVTKK
ncbi:MAG: DUF2807 domain-containing protein, partial [Bacteroidota bacterium]